MVPYHLSGENVDPKKIALNFFKKYFMSSSMKKKVWTVGLKFFPDTIFSWPVF